jgi:hypothetical protein
MTDPFDFQFGVQPKFLNLHQQVHQSNPVSTMRIDISGRFFIGGVLVLISTIAYPSQIFVFYGPLGGWTWSTAKVLVPLNILVAMVFYNYYLSCSTDPGRIPTDWVSLRESVTHTHTSHRSQAYESSTIGTSGYYCTTDRGRQADGYHRPTIL